MNPSIHERDSRKLGAGCTARGHVAGVIGRGARAPRLAISGGKLRRLLRHVRLNTGENLIGLVRHGGAGRNHDQTC